ncbi:fungal-specific transcription factor domain-containing protein [Phaeosphaeria sp. MPI-PUGE-AT-0046c]|nr:fungal-specific transcription factor domain-containing protein [Phaeosphaeria sp. MPI-PUGE-AT-0046c]
MYSPARPDTDGATSATTNGESSTARLPAAPPRSQIPPQPHTQLPAVQQRPPQAQPSPLTAVASPPVFSPLSAHGGHVNTAALQAPPQVAFSDRGRAQIACTHCRVQKVKCKLEDGHTICKRCSERSLQCVFEHNAATSTPRSSKLRGSTDGNNDPRSYKRKKTLAPSGHPYRHISIHEQDPLASTDLTPRVWEQLFDIYEQHFASDFPFLHRTRFLRPIHQHLANTSSATGSSPAPLPRPPHTRDLLLGFLTMTARYHDGLVASIGRKPLEVAEYFANLTQKSLFNPSHTAGSDPAANNFAPYLPLATLERTQTLLFLAFHRWTDMKGHTGWNFFGTAWIYITHLGYARDAKRVSPSTPRHDHKVSPEDLFITQEIERRTFWSCFILDRYIGCSKSRPSMIDVTNIHTQLPCSDDAFTQGSKVRTRFINEDDAKYNARIQNEYERARRDRHRFKFWGNGQGHHEVEWEVGKRESQLSVYIRAVAHFGEVMRWSNNDGRRQEVHPPWNPETKFFELQKRHEELLSALPKHITLTADNTAACIINKMSRNYISIHAVFSLCTIALYREYLALLPWDLKEPEGPLDEPRIVDPLPLEQPDYWIVQARKCFGAAREFADLLRTCKSRDALVESPIVVWTTYIVAWCVLYCHFFRNMDPDHVLTADDENTLWKSLCDMLLKHTYKRYAMAGQYADFLTIVHRLFKQKSAEYRKAVGPSGNTPESTTSDGGLTEYVLIEQMHKEMGPLEDETFSGEVPEAELRLCTESDIESRRSETTSPNAVFKHEDTPASTPVSTGFNSVNGNHTPHMRARSESQLFSSTRDHSRVNDTFIHGASISSPASHIPAHDRDDRWVTRSPTIGAGTGTATSNAAHYTYSSESVAPMSHQSQSDHSQANGPGYYDTTPQSHYAHARVPTNHSAHLEKLRGNVSVQMEDFHLLKDSDSGDVDPQVFDHEVTDWYLWGHQFRLNSGGLDGSVSLDQQCLNLEQYGGSAG